MTHNHTCIHIKVETFFTFRQALVIKRYRRSPSPKGEAMSSRPRDLHATPRFNANATANAAALIPREPEAKVSHCLVFIACQKFNLLIASGC